HVVVPLELRNPRGEADSRLRRSNLDLSQLGARSPDLSVRQHADELIAAVAQDGVLRPQAMFQRVAQAAKQGIAGGVALAVVGLLQTVEVDERDRQWRVVAPRARYLTLCDRDPGRPAQDAGQLIERGFLAEVEKRLGAHREEIFRPQ